MNIPPKQREIYLTPDKSVQINDQVFFQTGDDGVHQWESGIVLARYMLSLNLSCSILELGSGSGLVGIVCKKYTSASSVTLTDYNQKVLENLRLNLANNSVNTEVRYVDWRDPTTYTSRVDCVIGSDLIYDGAPITDLINCMLSHLNPNGQIFILMPDKRKMTPVFLNTAQQLGLTYTIQELSDWFTSSPHIDSQKGFQDFAELTVRKYLLYTLTLA